MMPMQNQVAGVLASLREKRPLVLCLTNTVVQNFTANLLLAVGAVPVMLSHEGEIDELLHSCANGLLVNLGTVNERQAQLMKSAVISAREAGVPWVLDPVAVGLLGFRTRLCASLLDTPPAMIRGNASEIMAVAGVQAAACRGPESGADSADAVAAARQLATRSGSTVLVTGEIDYISDGAITYGCSNSDVLLTRVTGAGCAMGALAAACLAVAESPLQAAAATAAILGVAGERAAARAKYPGSLVPALLDELAALRPDDVAETTRIFLV